MNFSFFYVNKFIQANTEARIYLNFKNLGPPTLHRELVLAQGLVLGYGAKQNFFNPFINSVSNQTGHKNSVGYSYNAYFNTIKTKQQTGIINFQFGSISFVIENDILAKPLLDRFRTGAFLLQYQHEDKFQAAINCTMWTGSMGKCINDNPRCRANCYIDTTGSTYANYSHGLLSAQFKYNIGLSQNVQTNIGIDAEQVRYAIQNKVIHDLNFLPKKWPKRINCHIPMLDDKGNQYLFQPDQKIKKKELYWNIFSNANLFY
ncbi:MAG: hypothetical protein K0S32_2210 [Bacteroidetes bacterium]|nr:hypothetical protein [Bacteroidota bacterium]